MHRADIEMKIKTDVSHMYMHMYMHGNTVSVPVGDVRRSHVSAMATCEPVACFVRLLRSLEASENCYC